MQGAGRFTFKDLRIVIPTGPIAVQIIRTVILVGVLAIRAKRLAMPERVLPDEAGRSID
jgi:hypothetical protein